jgi:hypothetical protein
MSGTVHAHVSRKDRFAVWCAGFIAVLAWVAFADHWRLNVERENGVMLAGLWRQLRFFTETTNVFVAVVFSLIALQWPRFASRRTLGGLALAVTLVAIVYWLVLHGATRNRSAWDASINILIHGAIPAAVVGYYVGLAEPGALTMTDAVRWAVYPVGYLAYAIGRGFFDGRLPYFFLDPARIGLAKVLLSTAAITVSFVGAGWLLVAWERRKTASSMMAQGQARNAQT